VPRAEGQEVVERASPGDPPRYTHTGWIERLPWLVQGTTGRGDGAGGNDLALFDPGTPPGAADPRPEAVDRWAALARELGFRGVAHARQVHGRRVLLHAGGVEGILLAGEADGHATAAAGLLLAVTVADCVPVFLVDPERRNLALLHAGWRGVAGGILEEGVGVLTRRLGSRVEALHLHLGPAVCGSCYEVGPEVHRALGLPEPPGPAPVDLRRLLAEQARRIGIAPEGVTVSGWCTRCPGSPFFSHRRGDRARQVAFLGRRE